ncbi:hypothetical protein M899_0507 [Bacteriovorax sp. BSW11_IV]|uniref:SRPBCC family protein n=1 Tax=Bacteriovorax sp. BSW11_IV TaxID=1353529 RepID=UPI00038A3E1F|nr:SRPBCC family protein [Bacteriovorax sp. BSW11_IV]EQC44981.1 hypothetical protein M899_0507 [Bacteriovorax sp. BSW11_IV]
MNDKLDLVLERVVDVSPELIFKAWTDAKGIKNWFCPSPWSVCECRIDLRPGGEFFTKMKSPDGEEFPNSGCYLEIVPNRKIVWTDCLDSDFRPRENGFFTAKLELTPEGSGTRYRATALHKDEQTRQKHAEMGFETGWGIVLDQMLAYIKSNY